MHYRSQVLRLVYAGLRKRNQRKKKAKTFLKPMTKSPIVFLTRLPTRFPPTFPIVTRFLTRSLVGLIQSQFTKSQLVPLLCNANEMKFYARFCVDCVRTFSVQQTIDSHEYLQENTIIMIQIYAPMRKYGQLIIFENF